MQRRTAGRGLGAVLFTDVVGSTAIAAEMGNTRWVELVARHHRIVRRSIARFGGREVDTAGDGFFVVFERPADAIRCAVEATEAVRELGIEIRAGVAFGELEVAERKPGGLVVNTAARVMSVAGPGELLVPASVRDIVPGSGITFVDHGVHRLKGLDDEFRLFSVTGVDGKAVAPPLEADEAVERRREIFPSGARRGALILGSGVGLVAVVIAAVVLWAGGEAQPARQAGPLAYAAARVDPDTGAVRATISLSGPGPGQPGLMGFIEHEVAAGQGGVWILRSPLLVHVDQRHLDVGSTAIDVGISTSQTVAVGFDAVWVLTGETLFRINPATDEVETFARLPTHFGLTTYSLALGRAIWMGVSDGTVTRIDPRTGDRRGVRTDLAIDGLAATNQRVWVSDVLAGGIVPLDASTLRPAGPLIDVRGNVDQIVGSGDTLWVLDRSVGVVKRIDATTGTVTGSARVGAHATDMAVGSGAVWVGDRDGSLFHVDPETLEVEESVIGAEVLGVAMDDETGSVWVYVGAPT